jgi:hypothetical protein
MLRDMNDDSMKKPNEPSAASLEEMPEISKPRFRRRPGRGHHSGRSVGEIVAIDAELWSHFGSADAVNDALRYVIAERKKVAGHQPSLLDDREAWSPSTKVVRPCFPASVGAVAGCRPMVIVGHLAVAPRRRAQKLHVHGPEHGATDTASSVPSNQPRTGLPHPRRRSRLRRLTRITGVTSRHRRSQ